jgi:hypothetical protein
MNKIQAILAGSTILAALLALLAWKTARRDGGQLRLLYAQMEEDHGMMVREYLKVRKQLDRPFRRDRGGPGVAHLPAQDDSEE